MVQPPHRAPDEAIKGVFWSQLGPIEIFLIKSRIDVVVDLTDFTPKDVRVKVKCY